MRQKTVLVTSYRRDGRAVGTPVSLAVDGDHAARLLAAKHPWLHGMLVPLTHRLGRAKTGKTVHFQLTPLQPGTRLTELEVAAVLGMSRTAVAGRLAVAVPHASVNFPVRHELRVRALTA